MKFLLNVTHQSRTTRRRCGKARSVIVDAPDGTEPLVVERSYESLWDAQHPGSHTIVKVTDVRELTPVEEVAPCAEKAVR